MTWHLYVGGAGDDPLDYELLLFSPSELATYCEIKGLPEMPKPPPPAETHTHCKACDGNTRFEKYWDFTSYDQYPDGLRVFYWCEICDGNKEAK